MKTWLVLALVLAWSACAEKNYADLVAFLKSEISNQTGLFYHKAFERLAYISDTYGPRMWGSQVLEQVIL